MIDHCHTRSIASENQTNIRAPTRPTNSRHKIRSSQTSIDRAFPLLHHHVYIDKNALVALQQPQSGLMSYQNWIPNTGPHHCPTCYTMQAMARPAQSRSSDIKAACPTGLRGQMQEKGRKRIRVVASALQTTSGRGFPDEQQHGMALH